MTRPRPWLAAAVLAAVAAGLGAGLRRRAPRPHPPVSELPGTPFVLQDVALASAGFRALAADLAWVELLRFLADRDLPGLPPERPGRPFDALLDLSRRVVRLDPAFHRAYLYGASVLGWFRIVDRPDEAALLLEEGLRRGADEPLLRVYLAALAYKRTGDDARMFALLEAAFDEPGTPSQARTILANAYKDRGDYAKALATWRRILASPRDEAEHGRARLQIADLRRRLAPDGAPQRTR